MYLLSLLINYKTRTKSPKKLLNFHKIRLTLVNYQFRVLKKFRIIDLAQEKDQLKNKIVNNRSRTVTKTRLRE